jgi:TonB family protein
VKPGQELYNCDIYKKNACAPVVVRRLYPNYTEEARKMESTGTVVLGFVVDERGKTSDVHVLEGVDKGLDEQATDAVRHWKFKPALYKGEPFTVNATVALEFGCQAAKFPRRFMAAQ